MFYIWLPTQPAICNNIPKPSFLSYFYFNLIEMSCQILFSPTWLFPGCSSRQTSLFTELRLRQVGLFQGPLLFLFIVLVPPIKWRFIVATSPAVLLQMWHLVRKQATATKAWRAEGRPTENPGSTIASLRARVPDKRRPASPNWACSMYVPFGTELFFFVWNPNAFNTSMSQCAHRCVTLEIKWLSASWRPTTTKWWLLNSTWMETLRRKLPHIWLVHIFKRVVLFLCFDRVRSGFKVFLWCRWRMASYCR